MQPYNTSAIHDAKDFMIEPSDVSCIENTQVLTQYRHNYHERAFYDILHRLLACLTSSTDCENNRLFLMPRELLAIVKEKESTVDLEPLEKLVASLFEKFPTMDMLFVNNSQFKEFDFMSSIQKSIKFGEPNSFTHDTSSIQRIPKEPSEFISDVESLLVSKKHFVEDIGIKLLTLVFNKEFNPDYYDHVWGGFAIMFDDVDEFEFNKEWFYKNARTGDVSSYGDFDMAYHAYINGSDIIPTLIQRYKELM